MEILELIGALIEAIQGVKSKSRIERISGWATLILLAALVLLVIAIII